MKEINQTTITIRRSGDTTSNINEYIYIPHMVDLIECTDASFIVNSADISDSNFYITSNLISNLHDNILTHGANYSRFGTSARKIFKNPSRIVNGNYSFNIFKTHTGALNNVANSSIIFTLKFIELEQTEKP